MRKFTRICALVMTFVCLICLTSCTGETAEARKTLEAMFDTLKSGEYSLACEAYISSMGADSDFLGCKDGYDEESFPAYAMHNALFESMEYKITKTTASEPARVAFLATVETIDLEPVAERLFEAAQDYNFMAENNEGKITEEEINAFLTQQMIDISKDYINGSDVKRKTTELEINVCYEKDRVWRVYPDDKLINVLTGGVYERYNELME